MTPIQTESASSRRVSLRVPAPLRIAIVRNKIFRLRELDFCDLLDISKGGISLSSSWLESEEGEKFNLRLFHGRNTYTTRGVVVRAVTRDKIYQYGLAFIYAPPDLERLIEIFQTDNAIKPEESVEEGPKSEYRRQGPRIDNLEAEIYVKETESTERFVLCHVDNISRGGIGFYCNSKIGASAPFDVLVKISNTSKNPIVTGKVLYRGKRANRYYYGMEYQLVSEELIQLIEKLE